MSLKVAFVHTLLAGSICAAAVFLRLFDDVFTDDGLDHYAEKPWQFLIDVTPAMKHVPMPGNTIVNIGYVAVAIYWITFILKQVKANVITHNQAYMFYVFACSSGLYAVIQVLRILTQSHHFAILDQWYTLPIFSWIIVWGTFLCDGWNPTRFIMIVSVSICTYTMALVKVAGYEDKGFEVALVLHIIIATSTAIRMKRLFRSEDTNHNFWLTFACCCGFVILKVLDHKLANLSTFFTILSGHFWSKIADFMQIYYASNFCWFATLQVNRGKMK